jgi:hypothetical protein
MLHAGPVGGLVKRGRIRALSAVLPKAQKPDRSGGRAGDAQGEKSLPIAMGLAYV